MRGLATAFPIARPELSFKGALDAMAATILGTLFWGVEPGVVLSLVLHLYRASRPHMAVVGNVCWTEHFGSRRTRRW